MKLFNIFLYLLGLIAVLIVVSLIMFNIAGKRANSYIGDFRPDVSSLKDGTYKGSYSYLIERVGAKITFDVNQGKLGKYQFEKLYGTLGYGAPNSVKAQIDLRRNLDFDAVSGATVTSNFAKAAIKNAIDNGPIK